MEQPVTLHWSGNEKTDGIEDKEEFSEGKSAKNKKTNLTHEEKWWNCSYAIGTQLAHSHPSFCGTEQQEVLLPSPGWDSTTGPRHP